MPHPEATKKVDRYAVVIPPGTRGPIAVTAAVYYQWVEGIGSLKSLGKMIDTNGNMTLEPGLLGGRCDGRKPTTEPPVVEGAPPVPMVARAATINVASSPADRQPPRAAAQPAP